MRARSARRGRGPTAFLLLALALSGCRTPQPPAPATPAAPATLVVVSIDGLRPADVTPAQMPTLDAIAAAGVRAEGMRPSYPALTFPNHYTLVTGKRPDRHGIVHNAMSDPRLGEFRVTRREAVENRAWWEGARPIWVSAERAGLAAFVNFWPGSEAPVDGTRPSRYRRYQSRLPAADSIANVLAWMRSAPRPPRLVLVYLDQVDQASHDHGPDSPQAVAARRQVDDAIGLLRQGLRESGRWPRTNLVVVSDHGFATVPPGQVLAVSAMAPDEIAESTSDGQVVGFRPRPGRTAAAEEALLGRHAHYACWRKRELPAGWQYGTHARVPPIICQMDAGWDALWDDKFAQRQRRPDATRGSHGYDPDLPSMRAVFIASGPAFARGVHLPVFANVDVYPLLMHLLGLPPEPGDGRITPLLPALAGAAPH